MLCSGGRLKISKGSRLPAPSTGRSDRRPRATMLADGPGDVDLSTRIETHLATLGRRAEIAPAEGEGYNSSSDQGKTWFARCDRLETGQCVRRLRTLHYGTVTMEKTLPECKVGRQLQLTCLCIYGHQLDARSDSCSASCMLQLYSYFVLRPCIE